MEAFVNRCSWSAIGGLALLAVGCGGDGSDDALAAFTLSDLEVFKTAVDFVRVGGTITLNAESAGEGAVSETTFFADEYTTALITVTDNLGQGLEPGESESFEISSIQAALLPDEDGFEQICVQFLAEDSNLLNPTQLGCLLGEPEQTTTTPPTPGTTEPAPEASPVVTITAPNDKGIIGVGEDVQLVGTAEDDNQSEDTLSAVWTVTPAGGGAPIVIPGGETPDSGGATLATWYGVTLGDWTVRLEVTDDTDRVEADEVTVSVLDREYADLDLDGFTPASGDCDDSDVLVHPDMDEVCDGVDTDCSGLVDDKDLDLDGHIDELCTNYPGGPVPVDDCDDADAQVHPGLPEFPDGKDNDCDGIAY